MTATTRGSEYIPSETPAGMGAVSMGEYWLHEPLRSLISQEEISQTVDRLAKRISRDYCDRVTVREPLLLIGILKGAVVFLSDLARALEIPTAMDFMAVSSYGSSTISSGVVRILHDLSTSIEDRHVLIVEDIVDTGLTLRYLCEHLASHDPNSLGVCVLLDKPDRRRVPVKLDYCGLQIPDEFVVGYGLDHDESYRDLPFVAVVEGESGKGGGG